MPKAITHKGLNTLAADWVFNSAKTFGIAERENDASILSWHDHAYMEIYCITRGQAAQKTLHRKETIKTGDVLFFNVGEAHSVIPGPVFSYFVLAITPPAVSRITEFIDNTPFMRQALFERFLAKRANGYGKISLSAKNAASLSLFCRTLHAELTGRSNGSDGVASLELYLILAHLARSLAAEKQRTPRTVDKRITHIMEHIQANPDGDLSAEALSAMTSLNKSYLSRLFTQTTQYTISDYIAEVRIEHACRLLKTTDLPVYRIAERSGYNDLSFFHEKFRELNGKTPAEYRSKYHDRKKP